MKINREQMLLEWYGGGDVELEQLTDDDAYILLNALGINGAAAKTVVRDINTILVLSDAPHTRTTFRNALFYGLTQLVNPAPIMAQLAAVRGGLQVSLEENPARP